MTSRMDDIADPDLSDPTSQTPTSQTLTSQTLTSQNNGVPDRRTDHVSAPSGRAEA